MKYRFIALLVVAAMLAVPAAYANEGKIILNPSNHNAQVYENFTVSMEFSGASDIITLLNESLTNVTQSVSVTSSNSLYANVTGAIQGNLSAATVSTLDFNLLGAKTLKGTSLFYNVSMGFSFLISGIYNSGSWNLSWRSSSFIANIGSYINSSFLKSSGITEIYVNMENMSLPLTQWTKNYNSTTNVTTFTHSTHLATTSPVTVDGLTMNVSYDPSYTIVAPGQATASANSISTGPATTGNSSPVSMELIYVIIAIVVVAGAGVTIMMLARNRGKQ